MNTFTIAAIVAILVVELVTMFENINSIATTDFVISCRGHSYG
jgi:hypothetical protein